MRQANDMEKLLTRISVPEVVTGEHRIRLKRQLVSQWHERATRVGLWKSLVSTPRRKVAFACCLILAIAAAAWAGQKAIKKVFFFEEVGPTEKVTSPEGKTIYRTSARAAAIASDDPDFNEEKARKQFDEIKKAIASGNAQLVETDREGVYTFKIVLSDGTIVGGEYAGRVPSEHKPKSPTSSSKDPSPNP